MAMDDAGNFVGLVPDAWLRPRIFAQRFDASGALKGGLPGERTTAASGGCRRNGQTGASSLCGKLRRQRIRHLAIVRRDGSPRAAAVHGNALTNREQFEPRTMSLNGAFVLICFPDYGFGQAPCSPSVSVRLAIRRSCPNRSLPIRTPSPLSTVHGSRRCGQLRRLVARSGRVALGTTVGRFGR
jgi:hypothetical protein